MCDLLSPEQMSLIHQMELAHHMNMCHNMRNLNSEVRADVQWQEKFQSRGECVPETESDWESDLESSDSDELVGLFGLHTSELCLVTAKKFTLWPHTRTYVQCQVICPDAIESDLYLCEALPEPE